MAILEPNYCEGKFLQSCEICGRPTIIPDELAGKEVGCRHCGGTFAAASLEIEPSVTLPPEQKVSTPRFKGWVRSATADLHRLAASVVAGWVQLLASAS